VKLSEIIRLTEARISAGKLTEDINVEKAFSSDLMSDVLTLDEENIILISGLAKGSLEHSNENGIPLLGTPIHTFEMAGNLFNDINVV
jgi:hypothetical protein